MSIYAAKRFQAHVDGLYAALGDTLVCEPVARLDLTHDGILGDRHQGATRQTGGREPWYKRGTEIRNERQISIVCPDEMARIAELMDVPQVDPSWVGANIALSGVPTLSMLPPRSLLFFESGATVKIDGQNAPCRFAGDAIAEQIKATDPKAVALSFPTAARGLRGLVGWVERPGAIGRGDQVRVQVPEQWIWPGSHG